MTPVARMDGRSCAFHLRGRCVRTRSPEASAEAHCLLMEARRKEGARALDRLQRLQRLADPADREVARRHVLGKNIQAVSRLTCPDFQPPVNGPLCMHQYLVYCVNRLPRCEGRCEDYVAKRPKAAQGGGP